MKTYFLYHAFCPDGFGAAYAYWKKYGDKNITFIPVNHGEPVPEMISGSHLVIADFSYKRDILLGLEKKFSKIEVLDHHATAKDDLEGISFAKFDMNRSGAVIVWQECFPDEKVPLLLQYVQDRDLWNFKLEKSKEVSAYIGTFEYDFAKWNALSLEIESDLENVIHIGSAILKREEQLVKDAAESVRIVEFAGHKIPTVNSSILHSDIGHYLLNKFSEYPFALIWNYREDGKVKISLRSRGNFDVAAIAKTYGGGGHKAAAGCRVDFIP